MKTKKRQPEKQVIWFSGCLDVCELNIELFFTVQEIAHTALLFVLQLLLLCGR